MSLEVRQMRHAIALAEHGSFARAAPAVGLSQSALSRSIKAVEREVGSQLFVRTASGVEVTDSGYLVIARIRQIVELSEDLDRELLGERALQGAHLNIGGGPYPTQTILADALARFVADYPRVIVRAMMREWDEMLRRLRAREVEFFVSEISTFGAESDLELEPLDPHPTFITARRGHPLASRAPISFADGLAYPYVSLTRIPPRVLEPIRRLLRRLPDPLSANRVFPALECNALEAIKRIVLGSDALMVVPLASVKDELESGALVVLGAEPQMELRYGIVRLKSHPLSAAASRFHEYLLDAERTFTEQEQELLERWRPRPRSAGQAGMPPRRPAGHGTPARRRKNTSPPEADEHR